jgi:hypothetical protein
MMDHGNWSPVEPTSEFDYDRAENGEQSQAFRELAQAMLSNRELAFRIIPVAEAWQKFQAKIE